jgi:hypothetical protein
MQGPSLGIATIKLYMCGVKHKDTSCTRETSQDIVKIIYWFKMRNCNRQEGFTELCSFIMEDIKIGEVNLFVF